MVARCVVMVMMVLSRAPMATNTKNSPNPQRRQARQEHRSQPGLSGDLRTAGQDHAHDRQQDAEVLQCCGELSREQSDGQRYEYAEC